MEYERVVQNDPATKEYLIRHHQKLAGSTTTSTRASEISLITVMAGLRYEDVPDLALILERTVRQGESLRIIISEIFKRYTLDHPWGHLMVGFWPAKRALGYAYIVRGFGFNAGAGRRWRTVGYVVAFLLVGPVCALLHMVILELKR